MVITVNVWLITYDSGQHLRLCFDVIPHPGHEPKPRRSKSKEHACGSRSVLIGHDVTVPDSGRSKGDENVSALRGSLQWT